MRRLAGCLPVPLFLPRPAAAAFPEWAAVPQAIPDTLPAHPLPGGVAEVVRFFMHVPQPIQIGGAILGAVLAAVAVAQLWRRRRAIWTWLRTRRRAVQVGLGTAVAAVVVVVATSGYTAWDYVEHDNAFCTGCHVMAPAYHKFVESEHAKLLCHDCHQQPLTASLRQLYLWVLDRPEEIGLHAPVPSRVCAECHIRDDPEERWERVAATAGHRVHLESDDPGLGDVMCVTCHGQEVHEFIPVDATCGQAGCHAPAETRIAIGEMAGQTGLHCVVCHEFAADVPVGLAVDTLVSPLAPGQRQCFRCHEMEVLVSAFDLEVDPHQGRCGACHDPHTQEVPALALATCTSGGCHESPETLTGFHRGISPGLLEDCAACHRPHGWRVDGADCLQCHPEVLGGRRVAAAWFPGGSGAATDVGGGPRVVLTATTPYGRGLATSPPSGGAGAQQEADFRHRDHADVPCTDCHSSERVHGEVTIRAPADCSACHHGPRGAAVGCGGCHRPGELRGVRSVPVRLELSVWDAPRSRRLPFDHAAHRDLACGRCHVGDRLRGEEAACEACHREHHGAAATTRCMSCHEEHRADAHTARVHLESCAGSGCHSDPPYTRLRDTRDFCLSCHQDREDHEPGERCMRCHLVRPGEPSPAGQAAGP